jgi:hypothetical protein
MGVRDLAFFASIIKKKESRGYSSRLNTNRGALLYYLYCVQLIN